MASIGVLAQSIDKMSRCRTSHQKEKWARAFFGRFSMGTPYVMKGKFRMALSELDLSHTYANEIFDQMDEGKIGKVEVNKIIVLLFGEGAEPDRFGVSSRYLSSRAKSNEAEAPDVRQQKLRQFWDVIGNRAITKGYKNVRQLTLAMDKDNNGYLCRAEARSFISRFLSTSHTQVDEWFELLDTNQHGDIDLKAFGRHLEPYFQKNFGNPAEELQDWIQHEKENEEVLRQREIRQLWRLIGERAQEKGFKSVQRLLGTLDLNDNGCVERVEVATWFDKYLNLPTHAADRFFDLLDIENLGSLNVREMRKHLEPYFQMTFSRESQLATDFEYAEAQSKEIIRQRSIKVMFDEIGSRCFQRGMKNERELMLAMDQNDSGHLNRDEIRMFFKTYLGYYTHEKADQFFDLLEVNGKVNSYDVRKYLSPYFTNEFIDPMQELDTWSQSHTSESGASSYRRHIATHNRESAEYAAVPRRSNSSAGSGPGSRSGSRLEESRPAQELEEVDFSDMIVAQFRRLVKTRGGVDGLNRAFGPGSQSITPEELEKILERLGLRMKQQDIGMLFQALDKQGKGRLSVSEVMRVISSSRSPR